MSHLTATAHKNASLWIVRSDVRPTARMRLICVPHAGAAASAYRHWHQSISQEIEVLSIQLPGRENRFLEPALTSLPALVDLLVVELGRWLDKPYALFGHSMGALIVFEIARALRARSMPAPSHLFVSAYPAPHRPNPRKALHRLTDGDLLAALRGLTARPDPAMDNAEFVRVLMPTLRADCALCSSYAWKSGVPLTCPITVFAGRADRIVTRADLQSWKRHTTACFDLQLFPGDHFYLDTARAHVLRAIQTRLQAADCSLGRGRAELTPAHGRVPGLESARSRRRGLQSTGQRSRRCTSRHGV